LLRMVQLLRICALILKIAIKSFDMAAYTPDTEK